MVSFRGQKKVGPSPDLSPLGVQLKIPNEHPPLSYGSPPRKGPQQVSQDDGFALLECQDSGFYSKIGARFGMKSTALDAGRTTQDLGYNHRVYGTEQKCRSG